MPSDVKSAHEGKRQHYDSPKVHLLLICNNKSAERSRKAASRMVGHSRPKGRSDAGCTAMAKQLNLRHL